MNPQLRYHALSRALDRALVRGVEQGSVSTSQHLAAAAARVLPRAPHLAESLVRYRLARNEPEIALLILEDLAVLSAPLRLLHCVVLLRLGRRDEVHLDLIRESARNDLSPAANNLLALLEWGLDEDLPQGNRFIRSLSPAELSTALAILLLRSPSPEQAAAWAEKIRALPSFRTDPEVDNLILGSVGQTRRDTRSEITPPEITQLAHELIATESVVPSLVKALTISFDHAEADLLSRALEHALPQMRQIIESCVALVRLLMLRDEPASARQWLEWGLQNHPRSVALIRLREEMDGSTCAGEVGTPAILATIGKNRQLGKAA